MRVKSMSPIGWADDDIVVVEYDIKARVLQSPCKVLLYKRADMQGLKDHMRAFADRFTVHAAKCYVQPRFSANEKRITFLVKRLQNPRSSHDIFTLTFRSYRDHNALCENFALEEYFHARLTLQQVNQVQHVKFSCAV